MLTSAMCLKKYGDPKLNHNMGVWQVPPELAKGKIPKKIYCNKDMIIPLSKAFANIIDRDLVHEFHTFDGCFNIRAKRGGKSLSLHAWGVAIDINASENKFGEKPSMSPELVKCFTDVGFDWGGTWSKADGMHFQLKG